MRFLWIPPLAALGRQFYPWDQYQDYRHQTPAERYEFIITRLDNARPREWRWIVVVAGVGFFTDAYSIFSANMVLPMMSIVYWNSSNWSASNAVPHGYEVALSIVTLGGALVGQIVFGVAADIWGRSKMYGMELVILIFATLGLALASSGAENSMSAIALFLCWRCLLGFGLGGDYPLSAVICSEFAPTRLRGRLLATVFFCQSLGQLAAQLVALIAVVGFRHHLPTDPNTTTCAKGCIRTVDTIWRLLVGLGAVPAFIALFFRLTIIESPRYTAEVTKKSLEATRDIQFYQRVSLDGSSPNIAAPPAPQPTGPIRRSPTQSASQQPTSNQPVQFYQRVSLDGSSPNIVEPLAPRPLGSIRQSPTQSDSQQSTSQQTANQGPANQEPNRPASAASLADEDSPSPLTFWRDFKLFLRHRNNFRKLAATSLCWFCLDLPFYGLGLMSPRITRTIWFGSKVSRTGLYQLLFQTAWQSMVVVSIGAIVGNLLSIRFIDQMGRYKMQLYGFFCLFLLNVIIGAVFQDLVGSNDPSALIALYILCQICFNFGPNTTTYMLPAEIFPTRFRCTCHGIAAACGKLGSVAAQCFLAFVDFGHGRNYTNVPDWLGYALLCLSFFMLMGLIITFFFIPDVRNRDGSIMSLEELSDGMLPDAEPAEALVNGDARPGSRPGSSHEMAPLDGGGARV